jgi:DeoR family transcriptional regulator, fructose operon transcriptional repressor
MEAETNRAFVASARRLVVVADHTKWGVVGLTTMASLRDADVLVTDDRLRPDARALLSELVRELVLAPLAAERAGMG